MSTPEQTDTLRSQFTRESIVEDYRVGFRSRHASLIGRKEVLTGKAKFGIFGDGKEVAQLAMARAFRKGDWRSGRFCKNSTARARRFSSPPTIWMKPTRFANELPSWITVKSSRRGRLKN